MECDGNAYICSKDAETLLELERGIERPRAPIVGERIYAYVIRESQQVSPIKIVAEDSRPERILTCHDE